MSFKINMHADALLDLENIHAFLHEFSADAAERTYALVKDAIRTLEDSSCRRPPQLESARVAVEVRHLLIGNYRALFYIKDDTVHVLRIVHIEPNGPSTLPTSFES